METEQIRRHVTSLFRRAAARSTRVGIEHELVAADRDTGAVVPIERIRRATCDAAYSPHLSFEPGGQVELSLPCAATGAAVARRLTAEVAAMRADCRAIGVRLDALPVDPRPAAAVSLQLTTRRYVAMQTHFDRIGTAGRQMMRRTASTQVGLDWWPGHAGLEQWRVLNLAAPYLAAAFARSSGADGRLTTWLAVDPARTAFDDRLLVGEDPVAAYAEFAAGAAVFTTPGDIGEHLSTLFPPVRPRGCYLEVRFPDVQDEAGVERMVSAFAALLYDDDRRRFWLRQLEPELSLTGDLWRAAAAGDPSVVARGRELAGSPRLEAVA